MAAENSEEPVETVNNSTSTSSTNTNSEPKTVTETADSWIEAQKFEISFDEANNQPPIPRIESISTQGKIDIVFNGEMVVVPDLAMINNGTTEIAGVEYPNLEVQLIPGVESEDILDKLKFTWNATE